MSDERLSRHYLWLFPELERLQTSGAPDRAVPGNRAIPVFPADSIVMKSVWWPIAQERLTALPVWDPEGNPQRSGQKLMIHSHCPHRR
jgi:hypothetical protein